MEVLLTLLELGVATLTRFELEEVEVWTAAEELLDPVPPAVPFLIYTLKRLPFPQYCVASPPHIFVQSAFPTIVEPVPIEFPHQPITLHQHFVLQL